MIERYRKQRLVGRTGAVEQWEASDRLLVSERFFAAPEDPTTIKLADLGIAAKIGNPSPLTDTGVRVGTLPYMAPEALDPATWRAEDAQPSEDVFAFGVLGWLLFKGAHPSGLREDASGIDFARAYEDYVSVPGAWLPSSDGDSFIEDVLKACLRLPAATRPRDASLVLRMLTEPELAAAASSRRQSRTRES